MVVLFLHFLESSYIYIFLLGRAGLVAGQAGLDGHVQLQPRDQKKLCKRLKVKKMGMLISPWYTKSTFEK